MTRVSAESMRMPFSSKAELLASGRHRPEVVEELYDLWQVAHTEAMELAARLPKVFGDPPRPDITLHVARGYDDEWSLSQERGSELAAQDPEQHWYEVTAEAVNEFQEYFSFTNAEGCRFYLPAYLRHYLADFPLSRYNAVVIACVTRSHFDLLITQQRAFVDEFLALCQAWDSDP